MSEPSDIAAKIRDVHMHVDNAQIGFDLAVDALEALEDSLSSQTEANKGPYAIVFLVREKLRLHVDELANAREQLGQLVKELRS